METKLCKCSVCGTYTYADKKEWLENSARCSSCKVPPVKKTIPQTIPQSNWVTTFQKREEVKEEVKVFPARLKVSVNPQKVSSRALLGGRTPEEIVIYQEERRKFGGALSKVDPRWAKLLTL